MARRGQADRVHEESAPEVRVIIVRLWWEQAGAGDVAMRARVTSTVNGPAGSSSAASTIDGVVDAVRGAVDRFLAARPAGTGGRMGSQVVTGATLQCSMGTTPSTFAASGATVSATAPAGVITDTAPGSVPPFGLCQSPANPPVAAATTAIYTGVSDEYRNRLLQRALGRHPELWESP